VKGGDGDSRLDRFPRGEVGLVLLFFFLFEGRVWPENELFQLTSFRDIVSGISTLEPTLLEVFVGGANTSSGEEQQTRIMAWMLGVATFPAGVYYWVLDHSESPRCFLVRKGDQEAGTAF